MPWSGLTWFKIGAAAVLLAAAFAAGWKASAWSWSSRYDSLRSEFVEFQASTAALGAQAAADAAKQERAARAAKDRADADAARARSDLAGLYAAYRSLRDSEARAGGGFVPPATSGAAGADRASFDRAGLDSALREFDRGVTSLLEEGDRAMTDLNTARRWAQTER